jgi:hypothetical protein
MIFTNNKQRVCLQVEIVYFAYFWNGIPFNRKRKFYITLITPAKMFWILPFRIFQLI